jgi:glycerophosphoryl diester phosphodiesterase
MAQPFELQGHRGARGRKPENTLPSFEAALDVGATSVETDLHLTRDGALVLVHDAVLSSSLYRLRERGAAPDPAHRPLVSTLTLAQLRCYRGDRNPDPARFPDQDAAATPLARWYADQQDLDPFGPPTLADLFAFVEAYAGPPGEEAGKTAAQRTKARRFRFDLELKRVPFYPAVTGDEFDGTHAGLLEQTLVEQVRAAGMVGRTAVRSFDHRCVRVLRQLEPRLTAGVLVAETAPVAPSQLARQADAQFYCPSFQYLDAEQVRQLHGEGIRILPWTVNEPDAWLRLLDWGVDGITTDFPDRLAELLQERLITF